MSEIRNHGLAGKGLDCPAKSPPVAAFAVGSVRRAFLSSNPWIPSFRSSPLAGWPTRSSLATCSGLPARVHEPVMAPRLRYDEP